MFSTDRVPASEKSCVQEDRYALRCLCLSFGFAHQVFDLTSPRDPLLVDTVLGNTCLEEGRPEQERVGTTAWPWTSEQRCEQRLVDGVVFVVFARWAALQSFQHRKDPHARVMSQGLPMTACQSVMIIEQEDVRSSAEHSSSSVSFWSFFSLNERIQLCKTMS